jgi:hypothetical protein
MSSKFIHSSRHSCSDLLKPRVWTSFARCTRNWDRVRNSLEPTNVADAGGRISNRVIFNFLL